MKETAKLTAKRVIRASKTPGRYHDGYGLYLQVINANNVSWQLRYERDGRERWLGLGPLHTVGLKEARERARDARSSCSMVSIQLTRSARNVRRRRLLRLS